MLSSPYWVKAKLLSTIQKVLPSLTPQSSSLIWLPTLHTTLNSSYCMHLICASIFFVPRELLLTLRDPIQTLPPFQSISWLLQAKQVVTLHLPLYYIFLLHLLFFFFVLFCLFVLLRSSAWVSLFFLSKILWTLNEHRLYLIHRFIPSTHHHSRYVPETWETLSIFLNFSSQHFMVSFPWSLKWHTSRKHNGIL